MSGFEIFFAAISCLSPLALWIASKRADEISKLTAAVDAAQKKVFELELKLAEHYVHKKDLERFGNDIKTAFKEGFADVKEDIRKIEQQFDLFRKDFG